MTHSCTHTHVIDAHTHMSTGGVQRNLLLQHHRNLLGLAGGGLQHSLHDVSRLFSGVRWGCRCRNRCDTGEWVMAHIYMRHVTLVNASCHTCECVVPQRCLMKMSMLRLVPHVCMRHVTLMNETCHTCEWVTWPLRMREATHVNVPCHTQSCRTYWSRKLGDCETFVCTKVE